MGGHLRLLNIACAAKAKRRLMTLTKPSREAPLPFILLGGSEKGFGIFVDSVDSGSKATEAGLKRGDQVMVFLNPNFEGECWCLFFSSSSVHWDMEINFMILFVDIRSKWSKL